MHDVCNSAMIGFLALALAQSASAETQVPPPAYRLAVLVQAENDSAKQVQGQVQSYVMREAATMGMSVVDPTNLAMVRETWSLAKLDKGTMPQGLSAIDADIVVFVALSVSDQGRVRPSSSFLSVRVALETRWLEVETGRVLGGTEVTGTGFGFDSAAGAQDAAKKAAKDLAAAIRDGLAQLATEPRKVDLLVRSAGAEIALPAVTSSLSKLTGVSDVGVTVRSVEASRLAVTFHGGDALALAALIDSAPFVPLRVIQATKAAVIASFAPMRASRIPTEVGAVFSGEATGWAWLRQTLPEIVATHLSNLDYLDATTAKRGGSALQIRAEVTLRDARRAQVSLTVLAQNAKIVGVTGEIETDSAAAQLGELSARLASALTARALERPGLITGLNRAALQDSASSLQIADARVDAVLPSRLSVYAKEGLMTLRIENKGESKIDEITAFVFAPKLMSLPSQTKLGSMLPASNKVVEATATLDADAVAKIRQQSSVQIEVELRGRQGDIWLTSHRVVPAVVLEMGAVDWGDTANAAAFVTPGAAQIRELAGALLTIDDENTPAEIARPAGALDALAALDIRYRPDPKTPFRAARFDNIQLPGETLAQKSGDCDDLSVLAASVLEALGVRTLLIATPEHILVAASTGISAEDKVSAPYSGRGWLTYEQQLWIPLEATRAAEGFLSAWQAGAQEIATKKFEVVDVWRAWSKFAPVPFSVTGAAPQLDSERFAKRHTQTAALLGEEWNKGSAQEIEKLRNASTDKPNDADSLLALGRAYGRAARFDEAAALLQRALARAEQTEQSGPRIRAMELLATVLAARGDTDGARTLLTKAEALGNLSGAGYANLGILHAISRNLTAAKQAFAKGAQNGGVRSLERVALKPTPSRPKNAPVQGAAAADGRDVRQLVDEVLDSLPTGGTPANKIAVFPLAGSRGSAPGDDPAVLLLQWP